MQELVLIRIKEEMCYLYFILKTEVYAEHRSYVP